MIGNNLSKYYPVPTTAYYIMSLSAREEMDLLVSSEFRVPSCKTLLLPASSRILNGRSIFGYNKNMHNSRGAYRLMKALFRLVDGGGAFQMRASLQQRRGVLNAQASKENRTFKYLQNSGYITELADGRFQITDLARINLLKEIIKQRKSDGKLRIVIFDIPEKMKRSRNFFRRDRKSTRLNSSH